MKIIAVVLLLLGFVSQASASPKWFRDIKGFWLPTFGLSVASGFDVWTTQRCISRVIGCDEGNVLLGNGAAREISLNLAADAALGFLTHRLKSDGDRWWWAPQLAPIGEHVGLGARNLRWHNVCDLQNGVEVCRGVL